MNMYINISKKSFQIISYLFKIKKIMVHYYFHFKGHFNFKGYPLNMTLYLAVYVKISLAYFRKMTTLRAAARTKIVTVQPETKNKSINTWGNK